LTNDAAGETARRIRFKRIGFQFRSISLPEALKRRFRYSLFNANEHFVLICAGACFKTESRLRSRCAKHIPRGGFPT